MKKKEKLKNNVALSANKGLTERIGRDTSSRPINLTPLPVNQVKCVNDVCCVTECYYKDGQLKCYTRCFQKGSPDHAWIYNT